MSGFDAPDSDTLRIMVATDNHLGFMERDPVRGKDSFAAFEEVLLLAKQRKVDFVLLGGDLFHENKPSRRTLYRTMDILRRHCMGDEPVSFQIISEQAQNFRDRFGHVNYEDPYFSVGLPIFSIHGNHDDPTREGGVEALAALDLLHVANMVNYFGKSDRVDDVEVNPILIQKGITKLALYGLGSMRDERLNRMWHQKKVRFLRPKEDESTEDGPKQFWNFFVLHQNRDLGRGKKNCVHESMIPEWMDLVIWGHEHECQVDIMDSLVGTFRITQPGSSVATSLCEGEAVPKHTGLVEIRGSGIRMLKLPLSQVRPFRVGDIVLNEIEGLDSTSANVDEAVGEALARRVEQMVQELHDEEAKMEREPPEGQEYLVEKRDQVLVRLRVEHSDFPTLNNQRFGSQFMGKVANPSDLLLFYRRRNVGGGAGAGSSSGGGTSRPGGLSDPIRPDSLDEMRVEDLVMENLENADKKLSLLVEPKLKIALEDYVHKGDAQAMNDLVKETLEGTQRALRKKAAGNAAMIDDAVAKMGQNERAKLEADRIRNAAEQQKQQQTKPGGASSTTGRRSDDLSDGEEDNVGDDGRVPPPAARGMSTGAAQSQSARRGRPARGGGGDDLEEDDGGVRRLAEAVRGGRERGEGREKSTRARGGYHGDEPDGEHNIEEIVSDDDGEDFIEATESTSRDKRKKNASSTAPKPARGGGRRVSARSVGRGGRVTYAENLDSDGDGSELEEVVAPRRGTRGKQRRTTTYGGGDDDDDEGYVDETGGDDDASDFEEEDDEDEEEKAGRGRGRGKRGGSGAVNGKGKAATTAASSTRSRASKSTPRALTMRGSGAVSGTRSGASANSRGKRRRAEGGDPHQPQAVVSQASPLGAGSRKRRLPAWASAASSGREGDDVEEVSSAVSAWGETR